MSNRHGIEVSRELINDNPPERERVEKLILDSSAGNRMMWSNKNPPLTVFMDKETRLRTPPDVFGCWESLPFRDNAFRCVIFDPPHKFNRRSGFWADPESPNYYGADIRREKLTSGIYHGTREFLRIAERLCFKWSDDEISLQRILSLFPKEWAETYRRGDDKIRVHGNTMWWITFLRSPSKKNEKYENPI